MNVNILLFIHGVVLETEAANHTAQYDALWQAIQAKQPILKDRINAVIPVEWGHAPLSPSDILLPDEELTAAENTLLAATAYDKIKARPTPDDSFLKLTPDFLPRLIVRPLTAQIKEKVITLGIADAFYYCAADGERAVRDHVYTQFLTGMAPYRDAENVALHLIGHSQGVTIGFDFLYGLFAPDSAYPSGVPGFVEDEQSSPEIQREYLHWRGMAQANQPGDARSGRLTLGSKSSFGTQVALMMLRKQILVDRLAQGERLDPTVIGVPKSGPPKWKIFFDTDDILGFPARRVFDSVGSIREYEVDSDWNPIASHYNYWTNDEVQREIADLIAANLI